MSVHIARRPAEEEAGPGPCVLVLGDRAESEWIGQALEREGFDVIFQHRRARLPSLVDPDAQATLRSIFRAFQSEKGGAGGGGSTRSAHWIHPGCSIWAERPELPQLGQELGMTVVTPPVRAMTLFSNKLNFLSEADRLQIPSLVLSYDPLQSVREIHDVVPGIFPLVLRSVWGGHESGVYVAHSQDDLGLGFQLWLEQLRRYQGEAIFYAERYLDGARFIEVPFARSGNGELEFFPLIDSSLRHRGRKLIDWCPAEGLDPDAAQRTREYVGKIAHHSGFVGVGTIDFLVDGSRIFVVDGHPCLSPSAPLWERMSGRRVVATQLAALYGRENFSVIKTQAPIHRQGMMARIYAEDPVLQLPRPGRLLEQGFPESQDLQGGYVSFEPMISHGEEVSNDSEGLLGTLIATGPSVSAVSELARNYLPRVWISGTLETNQRFVYELLAHPLVREGIFHTSFIDEEFIPELIAPDVISQAAVSLCQFMEKKPIPGWRIGNEVVRPEVGALAWKGPQVFSDTPHGPLVSGELELGDQGTQRVSAIPLGANRWHVRIGLWEFLVRPKRDPKSIDPSHPRPLLALTSGRVHAVFYREGAIAPAHEPLILIESMHILVPHALPTDCKIEKWLVHAEDRVTSGQVIAELFFEPKKGD